MFDVDKAAAAYLKFMEACDVPTDTAHAQDTPRRVANMFHEFTAGLRKPEFNFTAFPKTKRKHYDQLILEKGIPYSSLCAHHHAIFTGVAHVAYLPDTLIIGASKIIRAVKWVAAQPTIQEDLIEDLAELLMKQLKPLALCIYMSAEHQCIASRGIRTPGVQLVTTAFRGTGLSMKSEFLQLIQ